MRVNTQHQNTLGLNILTKDQCDEIHFATLEVLDDVGVNVFEDEALALLSVNGATVDGNRVKIPAWMVQEAL
jgi:trimethylamine---corrinoid protein Co-methyltransferase